jgi:hypothetical protein
MLSHRRISAAVLCSAAFGLAAAACTGTAVANNAIAPARAQARYYATLGQPAPAIGKVAAARAQARYYASFRNSEPLSPPRSGSDGSSRALLGIGLAIALLLAVAVITQARRLSVRRRATARAGRFAG